MKLFIHKLLLERETIFVRGAGPNGIQLTGLALQFATNTGYTFLPGVFISMGIPSPEWCRISKINNSF